MKLWSCPPGTPTSKATSGENQFQHEPGSPDVHLGLLLDRLLEGETEGRTEGADKDVRDGLFRLTEFALG